MEQLIHKHLIISAYVKTPADSASVVEDWIRELIKNIDMEILIEPKAIFYDGGIHNTGITATAVITTSSITYHDYRFEDGITRIEADIYSCKHYDPKDVIDMFMRFDPIKIYANFFDRDSDLGLAYDSEDNFKSPKYFLD